MKKSIAVILLGSAMLFSNNANAEAAYTQKNVQPYKVQYVQYNWGGKQSYFYDFTPYYNSGSRYNWNNSYNNQINTNQPTQAPSVEKPAPAPAPAPQQPAAETPAKPAQATQDASVSAVEQAVLNLTNAERQKAGLKPLQTDKNLMNSARQKSADMSAKNYFSHTSPTYGSPFDQMKANGVTYRAAAENIAMGQRSAEEVVKAWMESPGHRQNILTPEFTHIGIGFDANGNYWTQQFIQK
ncbi:CAP domain-containing protein [Sporosarcina sp. HYO08]|uniref:CAP domain-containing protein n=1 Tax=Sporosarcina sp. HYO08 TaxID=1759557 RepID=UPI00079AB9A8|nr:CAP domain-containing protein [Sporosarcina sp. HYO08]KXH81779.1 hypothetical protein AU377_05810 [Sporosarcina sp. HYO08]